jgi:4-carboxymuconolactone decarboxylase
MSVDDGNASSLPRDLHASSRSRLPPVSRDDLDEAGRKAFDAAASNPRSIARLQGPAGIRLHSPRSRELEYLRYETELGRRLTELAILVTAREMDQQFEWTLHEQEARQEGLEERIIDLVRLRLPVDGLDEREATIVRLGREIFESHRLSQETYAQTLALFGTKTLVDLVCLIGNYAGTAILLTAFDQQLPPGIEPRLPIP